MAEFGPPGYGLPRWSAFDVQGRWMGEIALPERLIATDVGSGYVLGLWSDELGIESVRMYDLIKPGITDRP
ncbi:MAG: hypothetical protein JSW71_21005 [Gemmatimonadota bacterium]|nr:MAG: hypothetical protein JSW71_21005 [Gemmatimonadota bacterium]